MPDFVKPPSCTLSQPLADERRLEFNELGRSARQITEITDGARWRFPISLAPDVEDLAQRERSCCGFLSITTLRVGDEIELTITAPNDEGRTVIRAFAGHATP